MSLADADPDAEPLEEPVAVTLGSQLLDAEPVSVATGVAEGHAEGVAVEDAEALGVQPVPRKIPTISTVEPSSTKRRATCCAVTPLASSPKCGAAVRGAAGAVTLLAPSPRTRSRGK
jgi:hypothetical protein